MTTTFERVTKIIVDHMGAQPEDVTEKSTFLDDFGADSLDVVDLIMAFEEEFGIDISDADAEKCVTVADTVGVIDRLIAEVKAA